MEALITRDWSGAVLEVRAAPQERLIEARVMTFEQPINCGPYHEVFAPDSFKSTLKKRGDRVKLLMHHDTTRPVGIANGWDVSATDLIGRFKVSRTPEGDSALEMAGDGTLDVSIGFIPAPGGDQWSQDRGTVRRTAVELHEVSLVALAAYPDARVLAVRSAARGTHLSSVLDWLATARK